MYNIHVFREPDGWEVWLDPECPDGEHDGLCIGQGRTRQEAFEDAIYELATADLKCQLELRDGTDKADSLGPIGEPDLPF